MNRLTSYILIRSNRCDVFPVCLICTGLVFSAGSFVQTLAQTSPLQAQAGPASAGQSYSTSTDASHLDEINRRLNDVTAALNQSQQLLEKSLFEIQQLRAQLNSLRAQETHAPGGMGSIALPGEQTNVDLTATSSSRLKDDVESLREEQHVLQAEIKQHDQIKVETASKYPLRISGLVLFNAFSNAGVVNNAELPALALPRNPGSSHGSLGASLRQTVLTFEATGPRLGDARSSAEVSMDFFGGMSSNAYGYSTTAGLVRMRQTQVGLDWDRTSVQAGFTGPLISPLSPTSFATVAQPALAGSGNLWVWTPQLRVERRILFSERHAVGVEGGLIFPKSAGYTSIQLDSPIEASRRPGYEGRISYRAGGATSGTAQTLVLGVGAYSGNQFYSSSTHVRSWAVTGDWLIPFKWVELSGEIYRGRALGGLGGSAYKDVLSGLDAVSGLPRTVGVDAVGGWSQLKFDLGSTLQANAMFGLDNAFSSNFDGLILSPTVDPLQFYARTSSVAGNLIFRPKTYLILSPEYRRVLSWRYAGFANIANIFTLTAGYQF